MSWALTGLVGIACAALIWGVARQGMGLGADFVIRYRPRGRTTVQGKLAAAKVGGVSAFFAQDLKPKGTVTVKGRRGAGGLLRLEVSGPLNAFDRQRVRNFLLEHLR
jgi:hypothetical protein